MQGTVFYALFSKVAYSVSLQWRAISAVRQNSVESTLVRSAVWERGNNRNLRALWCYGREVEGITRSCGQAIDPISGTVGLCKVIISHRKTGILA